MNNIIFAASTNLDLTHPRQSSHVHIILKYREEPEVLDSRMRRGRGEYLKRGEGENVTNRIRGTAR